MDTESGTPGWPGENGFGRMPREVEEIFWRDEILQIMYWMLGEGLGDTPTPAEVGRLLATDTPIVASHLERMVTIGDVDPMPAGRFKLTVQGVREGRRRFADEFEGMQFAGHAECNRPGCSCLELGPEACIGRAPAAAGVPA